MRSWADPDFTHIHDVGIDPISGAIFVGDLESDVVQKFTSTGEFILEFGGAGTGPGQFSGVWGISTDSSGQVYVADSNNGRVQVFTADGAFIDEWAGFTKPTGVFVDAEDSVHVSDLLANEVLVFDASGELQQRWDLETIVGSPSELEDIVISPDGVHIYLGDVLGHRVLHLTRD